MSQAFDPTKRDYTDEFEVISPQATALCNEIGLEDAINLLLGLEKKCRVSNDSKTLKAVCMQMVTLCKGKGNWERLNSILLLIHKRNTQNKLTISVIVEESLKYLDSTPSVDVRVDLIKTLKEIVDGKIYVEGESAHLHFMLSKIYEERGDLDQATEIVQDVHVETYGALTKKEKAVYILEQIRLNLARKDYIRALIASRKMNLKTVEEEGFEEIKIKYYTMMVEYFTVEKDTWEISNAYYKIAATTNSSTQEALESCIVFLVMSKFDNHQSDMMHRVNLQLKTDYKAITLDGAYLSALDLFTTPEIISSPFTGQEIIEAHPSLEKYASLGGDTKEFFITQVRNRVIQHNLRVVAKYYKRITMSRLCELLNLASDVLEVHLSEMASDMYLRIDRPAGIVNFSEKMNPEEVLSAWSSDIGKMLNLMESTCHLINRETMVYKA